MQRSHTKSSLEVRGLPRNLSGSGPLIRKAVGIALRHHGICTYAVSITFVDDQTMTRLNRRTLGRRGTTDVIAFDLAEEGLAHEAVGDIYVSLEQARRQSAAYGVRVGEEVVRLVIHGLLHTIGYSDRTVHQRKQMESCVELILKEARGSRVGAKTRGVR